MKKVIAGICAVVLMAPAAMALTDITVWDMYANTYFDGGPSGQPFEDQEVEAGAQANQTWDYEAFVLADDGSLGIIAGFDMKSGVAGLSGQYTTYQGDIFVRVGSPVDAYGVGVVGDPVAYDYVIHFPDTSFPWAVGEDTVPYEVYNFGEVIDIPTGDAAIVGGGALLEDWLWRVGRQQVEPFASGSADYADNLGDSFFGNAYAGGYHDYLSGIDLSWLDGQCVEFYTTMGCGNDILRGKVTDGGMSILLLGLSLLGIGGMRRRQAS